MGLYTFWRILTVSVNLAQLPCRNKDIHANLPWGSLAIEIKVTDERRTLTSVPRWYKQLHSALWLLFYNFLYFSFLKYLKFQICMVDICYWWMQNFLINIYTSLFHFLALILSFLKFSITFQNLLESFIYLWCFIRSSFCCSNIFF